MLQELQKPATVLWSPREICESKVVIYFTNNVMFFYTDGVDKTVLM